MHIRVCLFVFLLQLSRLKGEAPNTTLGNTTPINYYEVFINFRVEDIRPGFLSHLVEAFSRKQIIAFVDDKIRKGEEISESLVRAIENSLISLVIFSQDYASSRWCLDELVNIVKCRKKDGQKVLPVFYKVSPTDVRHQKGAFHKAFVEQERKYNTTTVLAWRSALKETAGISGFDSSHFLSDADLVEEITKRVLMILDHMHQFNSKAFIINGKQISHVESLLQVESKGVRAIGIWGMSGLGKTTIAGKIYERLCSEYDNYHFMANIREEWGRHGTVYLKEKLYSTLLGEAYGKPYALHGLPDTVLRRLRRMKVLLVLDDVNEPQQLASLISLEWFGEGTRIMITTRDKEVLTNIAAYEVKKMAFDESILLFSLHAFGKNHPKTGYQELSNRMVNYAQGVPLVLEVLGQFLRGKNKKIWESLSERLRKVPNKRVHETVKLSYNDLDWDEKNVLLDIACFLDGLHLKADNINALLKDHAYSLDVELESLRNKALITVSQDNVISMHSMIQETAWQIVREESFHNPGYRSRLLDPDDIYQVLKNNKGSEAIRSIAINLSIMKELQLDSQVFAKTSNLRYLDIYGKDSVDSCGRGLYLPQGLESLPDVLRYLRWEHYPLESLPTKFSGENLVILNLQYSQVKKLWHNKKDLVNLKVLILSLSNLVELPDLSKATNLKEIDLRMCHWLTSVHPSVFSLNKLESLDLSGCRSLTSLRSNIHLSSLRYLSLAGCGALEEFSVTSKNMVKLNLEITRIKQLPSSIGLQTELQKLLLSRSYIENLPETIKHLTRLRHLDLRHCSKLQSLPELPPSLKILDASNCVSLETVAFSSTALQQDKEKKTRVAFWNCLKLDKHSLKNIGLNAQINMMNSAYQHISTTSGHDLDAQTTYVYPGSSVPEWLEYRTAHDYMTIEHSFADHSSQLGFIFGFIVPEVASQGFVLRFNIGVGVDEGEDILQVYLDRPSEGIKSEHVYLIYNRGLSLYLNSRLTNQPKFKIKVTAESQTQTSGYMPLMRLRGFGFSPVNTTQYLNFIQQMPLLADVPSTPIWEPRVVESLLIAIFIGLFVKFVI